MATNERAAIRAEIEALGERLYGVGGSIFTHADMGPWQAYWLNARNHETDASGIGASLDQALRSLRSELLARLAVAS